MIEDMQLKDRETTMRMLEDRAWESVLFIESLPMHARYLGYQGSSFIPRLDFVKMDCVARAYSSVVLELIPCTFQRHSLPQTQMSHRLSFTAMTTNHANCDDCRLRFDDRLQGAQSDNLCAADLTP